ncbi:MAG: cytosolic protein [Magnetococcales bacterium]|nr:cytosolic protein [Magnetococcales bacterium]
MNKSRRRGKSEFDTPWKRIVEGYFQEFMAFFLPEAHDDIDWSRGHEFLDKELSRMARESEIGDRQMDKLVKVWKTGGDEQWVLIHADIQGDRQEQFESRMYTYQYRAYDLKKMVVVGLAILTDESPGWRPVAFRRTLWGSEVCYRFNTVKLLDYQNDLAALELSDNPFAVVVLAHLKAKETRTEPEARYQAKWRLMRTLYQRGFSRNRIIDLFTFVDWVLALTDAFEERFWDELKQFEESRKMPYITSVERIGQKRGRLEGRLEGKLEGKAEALIALLQRRFGSDAESVRSRVTGAEAQDLEIWLDRILEADSLHGVFQ